MNLTEEEIPADGVFNFKKQYYFFSDTKIIFSKMDIVLSKHSKSLAG